jgi:hypothetical protein
VVVDQQDPDPFGHSLILRLSLRGADP